MSEVRNILEARARRTLGVTPEAGDPLKTAADVTREQVQSAQALLKRDYSRAPRWAWLELDTLLGPMLPGDLTVVGAMHGNGKSALLMSQMDAFAEAKIPTLFVPLEVDPENCRTRWAAWRLNIDATKVLRHEWESLPYGSEGALDKVLKEQEVDPYIHFAPPKRLTFRELAKWCQWAKREFGVRVVMLDHFHRLAFGGQNVRMDATDAVRSIKDMARDLEVSVVVSAQLNRSSDPLDRYIPPSDARLKETAGLNEEADVVFMLSRKLRRDMPDGWQQDLKLGRIQEDDLAERNVMVITCRKHRLDDAALNGRVLLGVDRGRVVRLFR